MSFTKGRCGAWQVLAASACGLSHERKGQPCQDAYYWQTLPRGVLLAAVADGAGSATLAERGASLAARAAVESLRTCSSKLKVSSSDEQWSQSLIEALQAARQALAREATAREIDLQALATTLILLTAMPNLVAVAQVGDGAVVGGDLEGNPFALTIPPNREYINETVFLTSPEALESVQVKVWRGPIRHLALFSDGLQWLALKMPEGTPHAPFFIPSFRFLSSLQDLEQAQQQLERFLHSPRLKERTEDDLTLLLATHPVAFSTYR
ncbi:MAG: PP2C family serine/threonine-protein phosphatase [candidate division WOR-3 bacterium]